MLWVRESAYEIQEALLKENDMYNRQRKCGLNILNKQRYYFLKNYCNEVRYRVM